MVSISVITLEFTRGIYPTGSPIVFTLIKHGKNYIIMDYFLQVYKSASHLKITGERYDRSINEI